MHKRGIVHRDIKPDNILVMSSNYHVQLCDFGLSCHSSASKKELLRLQGTPGYIAPEHLNPEGYISGPKSDIFSLCAVFYSLVADDKLDLVCYGKSFEEVIFYNKKGRFNSMDALQNINNRSLSPYLI